MIFDFKCTKCGTVKEKYVTKSSPIPQCGCEEVAPMEKVEGIHAPALIFKGKNWAANGGSY